MEYGETLLYSRQGQFKLHVQALFEAISFELLNITPPQPSLAGVPNYVTVMNDALCREAWDKGCTDIMYMTNKYPN